VAVPGEDYEYEDVGPGAGPSTAGDEAEAPAEPVAPVAAAAAETPAGLVAADAEPPAAPATAGAEATPAAAAAAAEATPAAAPAAAQAPAEAPAPPPPPPVAATAPAPPPVAAPSPLAASAPPPPVDDWHTTALPTVASPAPPEPEPEPPAPEAPAPAPEARPITADAIRTAAEAAGLRLPGGLYAVLAAALATGHVVLVGPPASGKTTLALAIARAAVGAGQAEGAALATATHRWSARDTVGAPDGEAGLVVAAAARGRWLIADELDRARLDRALGALSAFLAGLPVELPGGEATAPPRWRIIATAGQTLTGSPALVGRFAHVRIPSPGDTGMAAQIDAAAGGDATAAAAVKRLLAVRELGPVGAGAFLAATRLAVARNAAAPADERTLAREALAAHITPLLGPLDDDARRRLAALTG
jgi:MoxR-like ATPase